ncbi:MAG: MBL fold metallo-hydrolase [Caryophanon sp.]|nr:MBL fold metallo-hydrolase [Caryophanon sp.]
MVQTTAAITNNITRVQLPLPYDLMSVNAYIFEGEHGITIVDTGDTMPAAKELWQRVIGDRHVERIVITHGHTDHLGCANWLKETYGAPIYMYDKTYARVERLKKGLASGGYTNPTDEVFALYGVHVELPNVEVTIDYANYVVEPDVLFTEATGVQLGDVQYDVLFTPGHSEDHVCFYNAEQGVLVIGDHLLEAINPVILPTLGFLNPIAPYLASFDRLEQLNAPYVLTGHLTLIPDLQQRIQRLRTHYHKRILQTFEAVASGNNTLHDVTAYVYAGKEGTIGHSMYAQTIAMLHYLAAIDKILIQDDGQTRTFALPTLF